MSKVQTARTLLGKLNSRGKAFWQEGNLRHLDRQLSNYGDDAARQGLKGKDLGRFTALSKQRADTFGKYTRHADEWANYTKGLTGGKRTAANIAGNITGGVYDMPRVMSLMPTSRMGAAAMIPTFAVGGAMGLDPFTQAGGIAYNTLGNPAGDVEKGFRAGADDAVHSTIGAFQGMNHGQRRKFLSAGGLTSIAPDLIAPDAVQGFKGTGAFSGPGMFNTVRTGNYSPEFYRAQALQKALPHMQKHFPGQMLGHTKNSNFVRTGLSWLKAAPGKAGKAIDPRQMGKTAPYTNRTPPKGKMRKGNAWKDKVYPWALPVGIGGALTYGSYSGAKQNAFDGGTLAGQDTALYGIQQGLQQMPGWQRELAAMFPGMASSFAMDKYNTLTNGTPYANRGGSRFGGDAGDRPNVGYAYTQADGNVVF